MVLEDSLRAAGRLSAVEGARDPQGMAGRLHSKRVLSLSCQERVDSDLPLRLDSMRLGVARRVLLSMQFMSVGQQIILL